VTNSVDACARPSDFIDIIQAVRIQNVLELANVRTAPMQGCFSEQARSVAGIADRSHPSRRSFRQFEWTIIPNTGVMWITPGCEREPRWKANRRVCHTIRKSNPLACDPIDVWSFDPVPGAPKRVGAKLVAHDEQNIGLHGTISV
jgi:hypothetical protein